MDMVSDTEININNNILVLVCVWQLTLGYTRSKTIHKQVKHVYVVMISVKL